MKLIILIILNNMAKIFMLPFLIMRKIMFLVYLYSKTNFKGLVRDEKCNRRYFFSERLLTDLAYINSLSNKGIKFRRVKALDIGNYWDKTIYLPYDKYDKIFGLVDYTKQLFLIILELKKQRNVIYPTPNEYLMWENKAYMHEKFEELKIPHPKTEIFYSFDDMVSLKPDFPFLIKEVHSCS